MGIMLQKKDEDTELNRRVTAELRRKMSENAAGDAELGTELFEMPKLPDLD